MLRIRKKLAEYGEIFFLIYILIIGGMRAIGRGTFDIIWLSGIAFLCLGIKIAVTDYSKRELIWMVAFAGVVIFNFLINHERTLLLTMISVYGAKSVNLHKVFFYSLWCKVLAFSTQIILVGLGVINSSYVRDMPKYFALQSEWKYYDVPCLGFTHPNYAYLSIIMSALLIILVYKEKMKWYIWGGMSIVLFLFYQVLLCRTGWYIWIIALMMVVFYKATEKLKLKDIYIKLLCIMPTMLAVFSLAMVILRAKGNEFTAWVNVCLTGRIQLAVVNALPDLFTLLGNPVRTANEIAYIQLPYNYGWILYIFLLVIYTRTMLLMSEKKEDYYVMVFAIISVYFLAEAVPLSVGWNVSMLLVAELLFQDGGKNYVSERVVD